MPKTATDYTEPIVQYPFTAESGVSASWEEGDYGAQIFIEIAPDNWQGDGTIKNWYGVNVVDDVIQKIGPTSKLGFLLRDVKAATGKVLGGGADPVEFLNEVLSEEIRGVFYPKFDYPGQDKPNKYIKIEGVGEEEDAPEEAASEEGDNELPFQNQEQFDAWVAESVSGLTKSEAKKWYKSDDVQAYEYATSQAVSYFRTLALETTEDGKFV